MSDGPVLGIDLGTTNSVVAIADGGQARVLTDEEGRRMVPSVVSFCPDGSVVVGYEARERRLVDAQNTVYAVKRLIGRPYDSPEVARARERFAFEIVQNKHGGSVVEVRKGTYALAEISAMVLKELRRVAQAQLGQDCERAVITVPANFNELQRSATKAAGKVAGLDVARILNEPTAAALAYGYGRGGSERVAVYDLGGGTFDITVLELEEDVFEVLATAGDTFLGGEDIDTSVGEAMSEAFAREHGWDPREDPQAFERLKAAGEWVKCQLSAEDSVEVTIEGLTRGGRGRPKDLRFSMSREELEQVARPWLRRSLDVCQQALRSAGLKASALDSVVLVGGSTRMPLCRQMVRAFFGKTPRADIDPDMVVAQGAAIHGFALAGPEARVQVPPAGGPSAAAIEAKRKQRRVKKTLVGVPLQPAFAPPEAPAPPPPPPRPKRATSAPPPVPDLPPPSSPPGRSAVPAAVVPAAVVAVKTPRTTIDLELDGLEPAGEEGDDLGALAPPSRPPASGTPDFFGDLGADDFFVPGDDGSQELPMPDLAVELGAEPRQGPGAGAPSPPPPPPHRPGEKKVQSREPTMPFSLERHAPGPGPGGGAFELDEPDGLPDGSRPLAGLGASPLPGLADERWQAQAPAAAAQPVVPMAEGPPPLLMDVTPHSLGVETAGGFCRRLIAKNAPVPTEQTRTFTTGQDEQREVAVRICQGENELFADNEILGEVLLDELPPKPRGGLAIEVAFMLDPDGTLAVQAKDAESGRTTHTRINLRGGLSDEDIDRMRERLEAEERSA